MSIVKAYAAKNASSALELFEYENNDLKNEEVEIKVEYCGICHSDLSMIHNHWQMTKYPFVPGHEIVGKVTAIGSNVTNIKVGDKVGLGWMSSSCLYCNQCLSGEHNLCSSVEQTIINRYGGFADTVRCHSIWAIRLPENLDESKLGPLFCGGLTVFNPLIQNNIKPTNRVGVIGIGGLGHLALQFMNKWGFSSLKKI